MVEHLWFPGNISYLRVAEPFFQVFLFILPGANIPVSLLKNALPFLPVGDHVYPSLPDSLDEFIPELLILFYIS